MLQVYPVTPHVPRVAVRISRTRASQSSKEVAAGPDQGSTDFQILC